MEPLTKLSIGRVALEFAGWAGVSTVALTVSTEEVALVVSLGGLLLGAVVWLVRLEGRINMLTAILERVEQHVEVLARHHGVPE